MSAMPTREPVRWQAERWLVVLKDGRIRTPMHGEMPELLARCPRQYLADAERAVRVRVTVEEIVE